MPWFRGSGGARPSKAMSWLTAVVGVGMVLCVVLFFIQPAIAVVVFIGLWIVTVIGIIDYHVKNATSAVMIDVNHPTECGGSTPLWIRRSDGRGVHPTRPREGGDSTPFWIFELPSDISPLGRVRCPALGSRIWCLPLFAALIVLAGCNRKTSSVPQPRPLSPQAKACTVTELRDAEAVLRALKERAWAFRYEGGYVDLQIEVFYVKGPKDELRELYEKLYQAENRVWRGVGGHLQHMGASLKNEGEITDTAQGYLVVSMPDRFGGLDDNPEDVIQMAWTVQIGPSPAEGDEQRRRRIGSQQAVALGSVLPAEFFDQSTRGQFSFGTFDAVPATDRQWELQPGQPVQLVNWQFGRETDDDRQRIVALVLTARQATAAEVQTGYEWKTVIAEAPSEPNGDTIR